MATTTILQSVSPDELSALIHAAVVSAHKQSSPKPPPDPRGEDRVLTRQEAARILRISMPTLSRRIKDGTIPVVRVCGRTLIRQEALIDLIERAESQKGGTL
jgi:excisionase family DNA binding protein